jgi:hypothetical protein
VHIEKATATRDRRLFAYVIRRAQVLNFLNKSLISFEISKSVGVTWVRTAIVSRFAALSLCIRRCTSSLSFSTRGFFVFVMYCDDVGPEDMWNLTPIAMRGGAVIRWNSSRGRNLTIKYPFWDVEEIYAGYGKLLWRMIAEGHVRGN